MPPTPDLEALLASPCEPITQDHDFGQTYIPPVAYMGSDLLPLEVVIDEHDRFDVIEQQPSLFSPHSPTDDPPSPPSTPLPPPPPPPSPETCEEGILGLSFADIIADATLGSGASTGVNSTSTTVCSEERCNDTCMDTEAHVQETASALTEAMNLANTTSDMVIMERVDAHEAITEAIAEATGNELVWGMRQLMWTRIPITTVAYNRNYSIPNKVWHESVSPPPLPSISQFRIYHKIPFATIQERKHQISEMGLPWDYTQYTNEQWSWLAGPPDKKRRFKKKEGEEESLLEKRECIFYGNGIHSIYLSITLFFPLLTCVLS